MSLIAIPAVNIYTLGELKAFITNAEQKGATDQTPISNTGMQGMSARSEDGHRLCFDEEGYEVDE